MKTTTKKAPLSWSMNDTPNKSRIVNGLFVNKPK